MSFRGKFISIVREFVPYGIIQKRKKKHMERKLRYCGNIVEPIYYSSCGEKCSIFYLQDDLLGWQFFSYTRSGIPSRLIWNRTNPSLKRHFYAHNEIDKQIGNPEHKYALLVETKEICPEPYSLLLNDKKLASTFDCIFTHSDELLEKYENAKFLPAGGVWYGTSTYGGIVSDRLYEYKKKNISLVCSNKSMCELHRIRLSLARKYNGSRLVDTFGTFDGGCYIKISDSLQDYRYSIVIENTISKYCFTEKLLNCFASMTIPIYLGASQIGLFFNLEGIVVISEQEAKNGLEDVIKRCTEDYYSDHIEAIKDNYRRVQHYTCQENYLLDNYYEELFL